MRKTVEINGTEYLIFTPDEAGAPDLHEGPWHFEPVGYEGGNAFSAGYETASDAESAAREWDFDYQIMEAEWAKHSEQPEEWRESDY